LLTHLGTHEIKPIRVQSKNALIMFLKLLFDIHLPQKTESSGLRLTAASAWTEHLRLVALDNLAGQGRPTLRGCDRFAKSCG
jgi:hypothetical protein